MYSIDYNIIRMCLYQSFTIAHVQCMVQCVYFYDYTLYVCTTREVGISFLLLLV